MTGIEISGKPASLGNASGQGAAAVMRVAHLHANWLPYSEVWLHRLVSRMPDEVEAHVICDRTTNLDRFPVEHLHIAIANRWLRSLANRLDLRGLRRGARAYAARRVSPHLLHSHFGPFGWENTPLARRLRVPHAVSFYGYDVTLPEHDKAWRSRYRDMFDNAAVVLCEGPHMTERIVAQGARPGQMRLFHLGIDLEHLPYRPRVWSGAEPLRVLIAGRFVEKKGMPYALDALARISSRVPLEIHLVGDADTTARSQAERARIDEAIERGGLAERAVRHGVVSYGCFIELAYRCHVFLSPSVHAADGDTEGGAPIAMAEIAATGMPIVTTTHCDIPYALGGGENAMLAPERDADALADLLLKLAQNAGGWQPMLAGARAHVEEFYDTAKQVIHLAKIYREVFGSS